MRRRKLHKLSIARTWQEVREFAMTLRERLNRSFLMKYEMRKRVLRFAMTLRERLNRSFLIKYEMRKRVLRFLFHTSFFLFFCLLLALPHKAQGQSHSKKKSVAKASGPIGATRYYRVAGLGSGKGDSANTFPYPIVILQVLDTAHTWIVVRFPETGLLGIGEDTVTHPTFKTNDTLLGYRSHQPLYLLTFPKTRYFIFVDVWSRKADSNGQYALLDSRPLEYDMNVEAYRKARLFYFHDPTAGMGSPTLRRRFKPTLLPFSIETNPGWASTESLDSTAAYALVFRDPRHTL